MIIVSIASVNHPQRLSMLIRTLDALNRQTVLPNLICVSLEGYEYVPPELKRFNDVIFCTCVESTGGISSFKYFDSHSSAICISLDDDLIFDDTLIQSFNSHINIYKEHVAVTYLSKSFTEIDQHTKYADYTGIHFSDFLSERSYCHILGSGISGFRSADIKGCYEYMFNSGIPGIFRDMLVSNYLWLKGVTIFRPPSADNFIVGEKCSVNCNDRKPITQRQDVFNNLRSKGFLDPMKFYSLKG